MFHRSVILSLHGELSPSLIVLSHHTRAAVYCQRDILQKVTILFRPPISRNHLERGAETWDNPGV
jgi:hypothetical protein